MKSINIKGKDYIEVNERLKHFRANYPDHSLTSEVLDKDAESIMIQATIADPQRKNTCSGYSPRRKG